MTTKHQPYDVPKCLDCHRAGQKTCIPIDRVWPGIRCDRCVTNGLPCSEPVYSRSTTQPHQTLSPQGSGGLSRGGVKQRSSKPAAAPMPFSQQVHDDDDDFQPAANNNHTAFKPRGDSNVRPSAVVQFQQSQPHRNLSMDDISISDDSRVSVNEHRRSGGEREKRRHKRRGSSVDDFRMSGQGNNNRDSWGQNPRGSHQGTPMGSHSGTPTHGGTPTRQQNVTFQDTTPTQQTVHNPINRGSGSRRVREMQQEMANAQRASQELHRTATDSSPDKASRRVSAPPPSAYKDPDDHHAAANHPDTHHGDNTPTQTPPTSTGKGASKLGRLIPWMKDKSSSAETTPTKIDPKTIQHPVLPQLPPANKQADSFQQPSPQPVPPPNLAVASQESIPMQQNKVPDRRTSTQQRTSQTQLPPQRNISTHQPAQQPMSPGAFGGAIPAGMAPIHWCTVSGDVNMLYTLLQCGADVAATTAAGLTCLHLAVAHRQPSIVQALLDAGADPNRRAPDGMTPLLLAISPQGGAGVGGDMEARKTVIRLLGARGADANVREHSSGRSALHVAVESGESGIVEALLGLRPDVDAVDGKGMTALHQSVVSGNVDMVRLLASAGGANLNALVGGAGGGGSIGGGGGQRGGHLAEPETDDEMF